MSIDRPAVEKGVKFAFEAMQAGAQIANTRKEQEINGHHFAAGVVRGNLRAVGGADLGAAGGGSAERCAGRGKEINKDEYRKLLLHPSWQKKRLEILNRDGFACRNCSDETSTLHVHHLHYIAGNAPWEYAEETLITLCDACHEAEHASRRQYEQGLIEQMRLLGLMSDDVGTIKNAVERLRFELGQEGARALLMSVLNAISWVSGRNEALKELHEASEAFIDRQAKWLESER